MYVGREKPQVQVACSSASASSYAFIKKSMCHGLLEPKLMIVALPAASSSLQEAWMDEVRAALCTQAFALHLRLRQISACT